LIIMVVFASFIGAVAILAGAASAVPMDYGPSSSGSYGSYSPPSGSSSNSYGNSGSYGNSQYGSGNYNMDSSSSSSTTWSMTTSMAAPMSTQTYSPPSYGSGSSSWSNGGDYNSCVQQCMSQYGSPGSMDMPPASTPTSGSGSGNGATHTVIVAPTQGVLRYVPFVLNASVGDTINFMWGANNHTVTKSSQLELCNKTSDAPFASGEHNKSFMFSQVVNDTNPTFYYCGTPTHCQKGMFGIINPPNAYQQPGSLSNMMPTLASMYPSTNASWAYSSNFTANNSVAANWGMNIDMSKMPNWTMPYIAENAMYSRVFLASNPSTISEDGTISLSSLSNGTMIVPADFAAAARQNNAGYGSPPSSSTSSSVAASPTSASGALKNGAGALASPRIVVALVAVAAAAFAL
jgi:plastocyanin